MTPARRLAIAGASTLALYVAYFYVPLSVGHTVPIFDIHPLGTWSIGPAAGVAAFLAAIWAALFAAYAAGYRGIRRSAREGEETEEAVRKRVYLFAAAATVLLVFLPSLLSKDVFDYIVQGRLLAIQRVNPFTVPADRFPRDEFVRAMGWPQFTTLYGPGWVSTAGILAFVSPSTLAGSVVVYKLLFALAHLLNGALVGAIRKGWGLRALEGEILYLWNPLILTQVAGDAHNDVFLMMWVLLGLFFWQRASSLGAGFERVLGVVCLSVSVLIKYVTAPFLLLALAKTVMSRRDLKGFAAASGLALVAAAIAALGFLPYLRGMDPLAILRPYQMGHYQGGVLMVLSMAASRVFPSGSAELSASASRLLGAVSLGLTALLALWAGLLALRARRDEDVARSGLLILLPYLLVVTALLRVSYGVWLVAVAALLAAGPSRRAALLFSASLGALEIYWVYAIRMTGEVPSLHREQAAATVVAVAIPISYLLAVRLSARARRVRAGATRRGGPRPDESD
ncbi:MAG TPA: hypothetical protein VE404_06860 [Verrucomicrobiae bacterium]|nr:hypothetical protein [Verrucomicrobiae bacterium]